MTLLQGNCPACGAAISFKAGATIVVVCDYCKSVVARTDRDLRDLGKVAEIADTGSPLDVGVRGSYNGVGFELTGRAQLGHESGGFWDEWYATFSDNSVGWLAEAQGKFYMTFPQQMPAGFMLPAYGPIEPGVPVLMPHGESLVVAEKGSAVRRSAKGEIPYQLQPGSSYYYADLAGPNGLFGTLDFGSDPAQVFLGQEVSLATLGLGSLRAVEREARSVGTAHLNCPNCGGGLDLKAPDQSLRVTCPNCNSLLDVTDGSNLKFLTALGPPPFAPAIPLGATGSLAQFEAGRPLTVLGFMSRSVTIEGVTYFWTEFLLYNPQVGFRWLVQSDDHWSFVQPVSPGDVVVAEKSAEYQGRKFKIFQDAPTRVEYVAGEFYWRVEVGEPCAATDYVAAPLMLSRERSGGYASGGGEVNWSLGTYVPRAEIEKAFGVRDLPAPGNIAPNQPFLLKDIYKYGLMLLPLLLVLAVVATVMSGTSVDRMAYAYQFPALPNEDGTQIAFTQPFHLDARRNVHVRVATPLDNSWFYVEGDLINDDTGLVQSFPVEVSYYHGVEDNEAWSEGAQNNDIYLSALPAGNYTLRLEAQWEKWQQPVTANISVEQNVVRGANFVVALIALAIVPLCVGIWQLIFESRRWKESMFSTSNSGGDDSDSGPDFD